tara:strand:+ start:543 stop:1427 length:885 start_codon:yes stop_codon:yes gene_type:complete
MHTPEHNPFILSQSTPLDFTYLPGGDTNAYDSFSGSFDLPYMQYTGIQDNILSALNNVLNFSGSGPLNPFASAVLTSDTPSNIPFDAENIVYDEGELYYDFEHDLDDFGTYGTWIDDSGTEVYGYARYIDGNWFNNDGLPISTPLEYQNMELTSDVDFSNIFSGLGSTNIFDEDSLAATLTQISGSGDPIKAAEVKALTPEMLEKTTSEYYDPYEQAERSKAIDTLGTRIGGVSTGGFAGSGGRQAGLSGAESLYRDDYKDIIADIQKLRGSATTDVLDTIYGWQELMSDPYGS